MKSTILPTIMVGIWLFDSKELISFPEPVALILIGVIFIGLANIGKKKLNKNCMRSEVQGSPFKVKLT